MRIMLITHTSVSAVAEQCLHRPKDCLASHTTMPAGRLGVHEGMEPGQLMPTGQRGVS